MIDQDNINEIKKTIEEFFKKATFEVEAEVLSFEENTLPVKIKTEEPRILIGQNGQTLAEIQHILKAMLRRKVPEQFYLNIDINDYKKKKTEYLKETAISLADEVALTKKEKILTAMSAYERRIVHLELAERKDITTESTGEEPERRVVIRPYV